ncbi:MAG: fumarylacetoacetate hydrolase family protein, partial [Pirellulales bacterium]|nr:fumarylacetoacetate hydrolase family protein [Pirellulales bacterium]
MRLISYVEAGGAQVAAVNHRGDWVDLHAADRDLPASMPDLLALGPDGLRRAATAARLGQPMDRTGKKLLAPVPRPEKIFCIGLNYADHARETGKEPPPEPVVFCKFATAVRADGDSIVLPRLSNRVDYDAELVAIIGVGGRHIPQAKA